MKKLLVVFAMLAGLSSFAAIQYEMVALSDGGYIINVTGGSGSLFVSEQGGGGDRFSNYTVGWYNYDSALSNNPTRADVTWAYNTDLPAAWSTTMKYLGEFSAGDQIGLYFVRYDDVNGVQEGATTGSWNGLNSRQTNVTDGNFYTSWQIYWSDMMFEGTPADGVIQPNHFMRYAVQPFLQNTMNPYYSVLDQMNPPGSSPAAPSGQPLPGLVAALVLGGAAMVGRKKFQKK